MLVVEKDTSLCPRTIETICSVKGLLYRTNSKMMSFGVASEVDVIISPLAVWYPGRNQDVGARKRLVRYTGVDHSIDSEIDQRDSKRVSMWYTLDSDLV